jgi:hypothetical protein
MGGAAAKQGGKNAGAPPATGGKSQRAPGMNRGAGMGRGQMR